MFSFIENPSIQKESRVDPFVEWDKTIVTMTLSLIVHQSHLKKSSIVHTSKQTRFSL